MHRGGTVSSLADAAALISSASLLKAPAQLLNRRITEGYGTPCSRTSDIDSDVCKSRFVLDAPAPSNGSARVPRGAASARHHPRLMP